MSTKQHSSNWAVVLTFLAVCMASYGARLVAGDIEIVCGGGAEHPERWTTAPPLQ